VWEPQTDICVNPTDITHKQFSLQWTNLFILWHILINSTMKLFFKKKISTKTGFKRKKLFFTWREKKNPPIPLLLFRCTSVVNGQTISCSLNILAKKKKTKRERVTGQTVIYSFQPINDNDLHVNQWLFRVSHFSYINWRVSPWASYTIQLCRDTINSR
jgi:hypothetical protein